MAGRQLGDAYITISPDTRLFRTMTDTQVRKELAGFNPKVRIGADTKAAQVAITSFQTRVGALSKQLSSLRADAKTKDAESKVASVQARVLTLAKQMRGLTMTADARKLDAQIAGEVAKLKGLQHQMSHLQADANTKAAAAKITGLQKQAFHLQDDLDKGKLKASVDIKDAEAKLESIDAQLRLLGKNARAVKLAAENKVILTQIEVVRASLSGLQAQARDIRLGANLDPAKLLAAESALLGIEHVVEALGKKDVPTAGTAMGAFFSSMNRGSTAASYGWKILTGHITLMGGLFNRLLPKMFTSVAVWHLLIDAAIEILAVWTPAIIAVTAFGVAGADAGKKIFQRMQAVHTVMDATGQAVPPLTNNFKHLANAVKPEVYQLFGDALLIMGKRGGAFNTVAIATGRVLDRLAARFVFAVTTGGGVNKFMEHAVQDVAKLGDSIGNLGGIFGAVFKAVPGYAEILLSVGDAITKVLETATRVAEPVIAAGLALHGFFIYGGLAVTVSLAMVAGVVKLIGAFGKFNEAVTLVGLNALKAFALGLLSGTKAAIGYGGALIDIARKQSIAGAASIALGDAQRQLTKIPVTFWAVAAAAALIALVHAVITSKDAAQQFNTTLQQTIQNAPLANVITTIQQAQAVTAARLASTTRNLNKAVKENTVVNAGRAGALNSNGTAIQNLDNAQRHYTEGVVQLSQQQKLVTSRFSGLSKEYGNNTAALGALNAAGITTSQITDKNSDHWAQALIQVHATTAAYAAMGTQAGVLGNDLDVLGRTVTDQYQAVQKLNQGWSAFITDVTGTQGAFDTVAQGFFTLQDHAGKLTFSLGKLKVKYADQKAAIDSLTPAGIALNQAFGDQVVNLDKLFASWRTAGLAGNLFTAGVKNGIAPLVKYARGSQEATAQLVALAQEAGYQGPVSLQALSKWLGNTHHATQKLKDITNQATVQEALLTGAMRAQGNYLSSTLIGDINNAILKYNGVRDAARKYGDAVAKSGRDSDAAHQARNRLITDLINSGRAAGDSTGQIAAMITKVLGIPPRKALQIVMHGDGSFVITSGTGQAPGTHTAGGRGSGFAAGGFIRRAAGGFINMGSGPTADDVPIMASRGEYVVKAASVDKYGSDFMDAINSGAFARGGMVGKYAAGGLVAHIGNAVFNGDTSVLSGQYVQTQADRFQKVMLAAEISKMKAALMQAKAAAQTAAAAAGTGGVSGAGPVGGDAGANLALARSMFPWPASQWPAFNTLEMHEAGYNRFARNASSGAYGIPQALPPTKMPFSAQAAGGSHAGPQLSWMFSYIRSTYGDPATAWARYYAHPGGVGWYAKGGLVRKMAEGGLVPGMAAGGVTGLRSRLAAEQAGERAKYSGLRHAFAAGPARYRTKTVTGELATLAKRQAAEQAAYAALAGSGLTTTRLHHLGATARAEIRTAADKGLSKLPGGHPGWAADLRKYLGQISGTASGTVAGGGSGGGSGGGPGAGTAAVRAALAREQSQEMSRYASLTRAASAALSTAKKGSWLYSHKTTVRNELGTLGRRQAAERAAYNRLGGKGLTAHNRSLLATAARAEAVTARDKALSRAEPGWTAGLRYWLAALNATALHGTRAPGGPGPVGGGPGGAQQKLAFSAWLPKLKAAQAREAADYRGLFAAFYVSLLHARPGSWIYKNRTGVRERLYAVAIKQNAETAAYNDLLRHSTGSVPDLNALSGRIGKLGSRARAEAGSLQPALLGHIPGGHPGWVKALQAQLNALAKLTAAPPFNPPWAPGNLGPSHTAPGGVLRFARGGMVPVRSFDSGGLWPSGTLGWNGSGRTETVTPAGGGSGPSEIHLHIHNNGVIGSQQQTDAWLQASLNRMARTGYLAQAVSRANGR